MGVPLYVKNFFYLAAFKMGWILQSCIITCLGEDHFQLKFWGDLLASTLMNLDIQISPQIWELLSHYFFKLALCFFLPLFSSGIPITSRLFLLMAFHDLHRLSSHFLILFSFCFSDWMVSNDLSPHPLFLSSAWSNLQLKISKKSSLQSLYSSTLGFLCFFTHGFHFFVKLLILFTHCFPTFIYLYVFL